MGGIRLAMIHSTLITTLSEVDQSLECFQRDNHNRVLIQQSQAIVGFYQRLYNSQNDST